MARESSRGSSLINAPLEVYFLSADVFSCSVSDCRCAGTGIPEHRSSARGPNGDQ